jgi:DNA adenine methylase
MQYLGGKSKISKWLGLSILSNTKQRNRFIEPFCGGGAMTAMLAPYFKDVLASDIHNDLIIMWQALQDGWIPPTTISESLYKELQHAEPSALRGFAGFALSWGGKWFGGYARGDGGNYAGVGTRSLMRGIKKMSNVKFEHKDYQDIVIEVGDVVYCDPPYINTTKYSNTFDSNVFWETMVQWSALGASVFVSEYSAPPNWKIIWSMECIPTMKPDFVTTRKVIEKLFTLDPVDVSMSETNWSALKKVKV